MKKTLWLTLILFLTASPTCLAATTFLPQHSQKLLSVSSGAYASRGKDITALYHLDLEFFQAVRDAGTNYTNISSNFDVVYPFYGSVIGTQKYNFLDARDVDAAYRFTAVNSPTFSSTGVACNGTTQYLDTKYNASTASGATNNVGFSVNERTSRSVISGQPIGVQALDGSFITYIIQITTPISFIFAGNGTQTALGTALAGSSLAFWSAQRTSSTNARIFRNGTAINNLVSNFISKANGSIYVCIENIAGVATFKPTDLNTDWISIQNTNITDAQQTELYNIQLKYNTTLGR